MIDTNQKHVFESELRELFTFGTKLVLKQLKLDNCVSQGPVS